MKRNRKEINHAPTNTNASYQTTFGLLQKDSRAALLMRFTLFEIINLRLVSPSFKMFVDHYFTENFAHNTVLLRELFLGTLSSQKKHHLLNYCKTSGLNDRLKNSDVFINRCLGFVLDYLFATEYTVIEGRTDVNLKRDAARELNTVLTEKQLEPCQTLAVIFMIQAMQLTQKEIGRHLPWLNAQIFKFLSLKMDDKLALNFLCQLLNESKIISTWQKIALYSSHNDYPSCYFLYMQFANRVMWQDELLNRLEENLRIELPYLEIDTKLKAKLEVSMRIILNCRNGKLNDADLKEALFINLSGATVPQHRRYLFKQKQLEYANLSNISGSEVQFYKTKLCYATLTSAQLFRARFSQSDLFGANLTDLEFTQSNFNDADLRNTNLTTRRLTNKHCLFNDNTKFTSPGKKNNAQQKQPSAKKTKLTAGK